ncbi:hypothetical protein [Nocardia abscessus]|uniref:hypothetical protein n=1 Tax=Nocardia abscessus TaxID=120957 RepID=UPI00245538D2|nr:hypothetical protein [Nocardia abscessus]
MEGEHGSRHRTIVQQAHPGSHKHPGVWHARSDSRLEPARRVALRYALRRPPRTLKQYLGTTVIGLGITGIVGGAALILEADTLVGVTVIGLGAAAIGGGTALTLEADTLFGVTVIGLGAAMIGWLRS